MRKDEAELEKFKSLKDLDPRSNKVKDFKRLAYHRNKSRKDRGIVRKLTMNHEKSSKGAESSSNRSSTRHWRCRFAFVSLNSSKWDKVSNACTSFSIHFSEVDSARNCLDRRALLRGCTGSLVRSAPKIADENVAGADVNFPAFVFQHFLFLHVELERHSTWSILLRLPWCSYTSPWFWPFSLPT